MPSADQRRFPRKSISVEFSGKDSQGFGQLVFEGSDLSKGGTFLKSDLLLEEDELLSVEFRIPGVERPFTAQARVAWVRRFPARDEPPGMGLAFIGMPAEDQRLLESHLDALEP